MLIPKNGNIGTNENPISLYFFMCSIIMGVHNKGNKIEMGHSGNPVGDFILKRYTALKMMFCPYHRY